MNDLISTMNSELDKIMMWLNVNKLSLNVTKSHYILFSNNKIRPESSVIMNGEIVKRVSSTKFLGVCIDERLSWKPHIAYIKGKISGTIGIL